MNVHMMQVHLMPVIYSGLLVLVVSGCGSGNSSGKGVVVSGGQAEKQTKHWNHNHCRGTRKETRDGS